MCWHWVGPLGFPPYSAFLSTRQAVFDWSVYQKKTCRKATNQTKEDSYWKSFFLAQSWILLNSDHRFPKQRWWFHRHILGKIHAVWPIFQIDGLFSPPRNNINNQHHRSQHLLGVFGGGNYLQFTQLTLGSASPRFGPVRVMLGSNEGNVLCDVS